MISLILQTGGYFKYIDSWHLKFASWAEDEPSRDRPCVYMDVNGKWRTAFCNRTMNSVCMQTMGNECQPEDCHQDLYLNIVIGKIVNMISPILIHLMQRCHQQSRASFQEFVPKTQKRNTKRVIRGCPLRVIVTCISLMKLNGPVPLEAV